MGLRLRQFNMKVRQDSNHPFIDVGLLGSDVDADLEELKDKTEWVVTPQMFGAKGDGVTDDTEAIQSAINESKCIAFPEGVYLVTASIDVTHQIKVFGCGNRNSVIKTETDIPIFKIANSVSDAFLIGNSVFEELGFASVGSAYGTNACGYGILFGDMSDSSTLMNLPHIRLKNCRFSGFRTGLYLEGYGHTITGTYFTSCETGAELIHPEQVLIDNSWFEYSNVGLRVNNTKQQYGHNMQIVGGSIQRCNYGAKIFNFYEPTISTYCELNKYSDFEFGDSANPTVYSHGCKNIRLNYNTTGEDSSNTATRLYSVGLYATVGADIDIVNYSSYAGNNTPNVFANGYSKFLRIYSHTEGIGASSTPYTIEGDCGKSTYVYLDGNQHYTPIRTSTSYKVRYTDGINEPFAVESLEYQGSTKRKTEYNNSGENIYLSKAANSQLAVFDSSDNSTLFSIMNNPSASYRVIRAGIPIAFLDSSDSNYKHVRVYNNELQMYYNNAWNSVMMVKENTDNTYHPLRLNNGVLQYYGSGSWKNVKATSA